MRKLAIALPLFIAALVNIAPQPALSDDDSRDYWRRGDMHRDYYRDNGWHRGYYNNRSYNYAPGWSNPYHRGYYDNGYGRPWQRTLRHFMYSF